ncbi:hypothetical protein [Oligoflexus sp.]|uniref:hypothetical protein n=1 Tax=Oligoflexus sp. TaxID=1971216 RepID=UPI002D769FEC|nr:hypothetical protein [Oligoflexus sp.]
MSQTCNKEDVISQKECLHSLTRTLQTCIDGANKATENANSRVTNIVKDKAKAVVGPLTSDRDNGLVALSRIKGVLAAHEGSTKATQQRFTALVEDFKQNVKDRDEAVIQAHVREVAASAEGTDRLRLVAVLSDLEDIRQEDLFVTRSLRDRCLALKSWMAYLTKSISKGIGQDLAFVKSHGLAGMLDPFANLSSILDKIIGYVDNREKSVDETVTAMKEQVAIRIERLRRIEVEKETAETLKTSAYLDSVQKFYGEIEDAKYAAFKEGNKSVRTNLPYYGDQLAALKRFLAYGGYCNSNPKPKWMESGCLRYSSFEINAKKLASGGLVKNIQLRLDIIDSQDRDIAPAIRQKLKDHIANRNYEDAIKLYDTILAMEKPL